MFLNDQMLKQWYCSFYIVNCCRVVAYIDQLYSAVLLWLYRLNFQKSIT